MAESGGRRYSSEIDTCRAGEASHVLDEVCSGHAISLFNKLSISKILIDQGDFIGPRKASFSD